MMSWLFWLLLGVALAATYSAITSPDKGEEVGSVHSAENEFGAIFPVQWHLPFMGYDWVVEEMRESTAVYAARCPRDLNAAFTYWDRRMHKTVRIMFANGWARAEVADGHVQHLPGNSRTH